MSSKGKRRIVAGDVPSNNSRSDRQRMPSAPGSGVQGRGPALFARVQDARSLAGPFEERSGRLLFVGVDPRMKPLSSDAGSTL
jgi:hypothetical protein